MPVTSGVNPGVHGDAALGEAQAPKALRDEGEGGAEVRAREGVFLALERSDEHLVRLASGERAQEQQAVALAPDHDHVPGLRQQRGGVAQVGQVDLGVEDGVIRGVTTTMERLMLTTGVMGGFTTYSTFNYETMEYLREGAFWLAGLNVAATLLLCLLAGALGLALARWLVGS